MESVVSTFHMHCIINSSLASASSQSFQELFSYLYGLSITYCHVVSQEVKKYTRARLQWSTVEPTYQEM